MSDWQLHEAIQRAALEKAADALLADATDPREVVIEVLRTCRVQYGTDRAMAESYDWVRKTNRESAQQQLDWYQAECARAIRRELDRPDRSSDVVGRSYRAGLRRGRAIVLRTPPPAVI